MGISYEANAGYGIKVTDEMCSKISPYLGVEFDGEDIDGFMDTVLSGSDLRTTVTGNCYYGEPLDVWIMISDPLNSNVDEFIEKLNKLSFNLDIKSYKDLQWICEIWVG